MSVLDLEAHRKRLRALRSDIAKRLWHVAERIERNWEPPVGTNATALRSIADELEELERRVR